MCVQHAIAIPKTYLFMRKKVNSMATYGEGMQRGKTNTMENVCLGILGGCPEHGQEAGK